MCLLINIIRRWLIYKANYTISLVWNTLKHNIQLYSSIFFHRRKRPASRPTEAPSCDNHVYYNEQSVARAAKNQPQNNQQTSPGASLDELYSKPNKQRKSATVSQDYEYVYGHGAAGGNRGAREGMSGDGNQGLDYVNINHSVTPDPRSVGLNPGSPGVIYAEIQRKRKDTDTVQQVDNGATPGDNDMVMIENDLYAT